MFDKQKGKKEGSFRTSEPDPGRSTGPLSSPASQPAAKAAVIGPAIVINGDITGNENLVIEGKVKGQVKLISHEVTVGQSGEVNADVMAKLIRVAGKVIGDMTAKEKVIISSTGNVHGNIVTPRMLLEDGAIFKGSIDMDPGEAAVGQSAVSASRPAVKPATSPELVQDASKKGPDLALKSG